MNLDAALQEQNKEICHNIDVYHSLLQGNS